MRLSADPGVSQKLMWATYLVGAGGVFVSLYYLGSGDRAASAAWVSALAVGGSGIISFVRHSVFHRSDAVRMGWDLGRRNDFQIEVGFANLAWGLAGVAAWALSWGTKAQGAVTIVFGLYLLFAAVLHVSNVAKPAEEGGRRYGPIISLTMFSIMLLIPGVAAVTA